MRFLCSIIEVARKERNSKDPKTTRIMIRGPSQRMERLVMEGEPNNRQRF